MSNNTLATAYLKEVEAEYTSTRKCLERISLDLWDFKPHEKSMQMGYLTLLVAEIPLWLKYIVETGDIDLATFERFQPTSTEDLLQRYESNIAGAKNALQNTTDEALEAGFQLKQGGQLLYEQSRLDAVSSSINHWVHHRGQLTVYMRLNDIAVPSIYGPSADDRTF